MISTAIRAKPWILIDDASSDPAHRTPLLTALLERGFPVQLSHESDLAPIDRPASIDSAECTEDTDDVSVVRRIVLRRTADSEPEEGSSGNVQAIDVSNLQVEDIVATVERSFQDGGAPSRAWKPWFPVIDFSRCTNCMQCLSFCLFNVYSATPEGKITVQNENNCKTDCPACSRVCPEVAIMFPKYKAGPINGDIVNSDDVRREGMKVDISALLGGDIYSMLRDRSVKAKSRFSAERDDERALKERQRCLDKLKTLMTDLDIPMEVLSSLPNRDQIEAKAKEAQEKAKAVLASNAQNHTTSE